MNKTIYFDQLHEFPRPYEVQQVGKVLKILFVALEHCDTVISAFFWTMQIIMIVQTNLPIVTIKRHRIGVIGFRSAAIVICLGNLGTTPRTAGAYTLTVGECSNDPLMQINCYCLHRYAGHIRAWRYRTLQS